MNLPEPGAAPFHLLTLGPFAEPTVQARRIDGGMARNSEIERVIAETWMERTSAAAARGQSLFPGPLCRFESWRIDEGMLALTFSRTDYRELVGTNLAHPEIAANFGPEFLSDGTGISSVIETTDGQLILQRRSERVFEYPGKLHVCGGAIDDEAISPDGSIDLFSAMRRELDEELGITTADIIEMTCLGIARDGLTLKPEVLTQTKVNLDAAELVDRQGDEHTELIMVDTAMVSGWMTTHWNELAPAGLAGLSAYLACRFAAGLAWSWSN